MGHATRKHLSSQTYKLISLAQTTGKEITYRKTQNKINTLRLLHNYSKFNTTTTMYNDMRPLYNRK